MLFLDLPHKVLDYACPINGLEDQYEWKTGVRLPGYCLMDLGTIGFTYIKQKNAPAPRMIFWGSGMGRHLFDFLADVVGFEWTCLEGRAFSVAWKAAQNALANGTPVLLGILDMYHLPYYPKFYHRMHIPIHYVLLVGYDPQKEVALVQDTGLPGVQRLSLSDLQAALDVYVPGQGKSNTLATFKFAERPASVEAIWRTGLKKRAKIFLDPPVGFLGLKGLRKAQQEISGWQGELSQSQWTESLRSLATFTCSVVPNLPQALLPFSLGYDDPHQACRDRFAGELAAAAIEFGEARWSQAAECFRKSGENISRLTEMTVAALTGKNDFHGASDIMADILTMEEQAFQLLL